MLSTIDGPAVPPGEVAWLRFDVSVQNDHVATVFEGTLGSDAGGVVVDARYSDVNGDQAARVEVVLKYDESRGWQLVEARQFHAEETSPYAVLPSRSVTVAGA